MMIIGIGLYVLIACFIFGVGLETEPIMPLFFVLIASIFWPITVMIGMGISAANKRKY